MRMIFNLLLNSLAIFVVSYILPGVKVESFWIAVIVAVVLGVINVILKPILIILTLPINILTFGLFTIVINGFLIILAGKIVPGFMVKSFWWAVLFSILISIVSSFLHSLSREGSY
ncbi:MAG: phage holin family protein [Firmicutes bacterium]|nr:phage holin family protein [Bacillota bacterium]